MRGARETPSTCAALSGDARPLASRIFQFNIQRLFSSPLYFFHSEIMNIEQAQAAPVASRDRVD